MLRKFKERALKWWIRTNTSQVRTYDDCWCYTHAVDHTYFSHSKVGFYAYIHGYPIPISDGGPLLKEDFVNAVYKHLTDGTTN